MKAQESKLQIACVTWFRYAYPKYALNLFSVPNGGYRRITTAITMQKEGALSGVSDLILLLPNDKYAALCLELKIKPNKQSLNQKIWEKHITEFKVEYKLIHNLEQFIDETNEYIKCVNYA